MYSCFLLNHSGDGRLRSRLEAFISSVLQVLREGRRGGAREFHITRNLHAVLGIMCTDEKEIEVLNEMYGSLCWQRYDKGPWGL